MNGRTHAALGAGVGSLVAAATGAPFGYCLVAGVIGGLIPDIDHPQSIISGWIPLSGLVRIGTRHRGFTHSILFVMLCIGVWFAAASSVPVPYPYSVSFFAGIASHILSDMLTPAGVRLLFPVRYNFAAAPRVFLQAGKWFGIIGLLAFLAGVAMMGFSFWWIYVR